MEGVFTMFYRFNRLFNVSKTRALVVAILCFLAGCPLMIASVLDDPVWFMIGGAFWGYALIYGGIWCYKFCRDMDIRIKAEHDYYSQQLQQQEVMPPMTNPGNSRLFVPKPLDRP
jgi:hypothetical protein